VKLQTANFPLPNNLPLQNIFSLLLHWTSPSPSKKAALPYLSIIFKKVLLDRGQSLLNGPPVVALPIASLFLVLEQPASSLTVTALRAALSCCE